MPRKNTVTYGGVYGEDGLASVNIMALWRCGGCLPGKVLGFPPVLLATTSNTQGILVLSIIYSSIRGVHAIMAICIVVN